MTIVEGELFDDINDCYNGTPNYGDDNPLMRKDFEEQTDCILTESQVLDEDYEEFEEEYEPSITKSLTPNAVQLDWNIPSEFPCCPKDPTDNPLESYISNLKYDAVFCRNNYYSSLVVDSVIIDEGNTLLVMSRSARQAIKPWALARVYYYEGFYFHESLGSFFDKNGVEKYYTLAQGKEWTGGDTIEDYC